eukprot:scaffold2250_cov399-Prasinococcus_capsulatus_cf.AAC.18
MLRRGPPPEKRPKPPQSGPAAALSGPYGALLRGAGPLGGGRRRVAAPRARFSQEHLQGSGRTGRHGPSYDSFLSRFRPWKRLRRICMGLRDLNGRLSAPAAPEPVQWEGGCRPRSFRRSRLGHSARVCEDACGLSGEGSPGNPAPLRQPSLTHAFSCGSRPPRWGPGGGPRRGPKK